MQFEGAYLEDGKGWSIWDTYTNFPGQCPSGVMVHENATGMVNSLKQQMLEIACKGKGHNALMAVPVCLTHFRIIIDSLYILQVMLLATSTIVTQKI